MNKYFLLFITSLVILSCNSSDKSVPATATPIPDAAIPEQERQLREKILQHPDSVLLKQNLIEYLKGNGNYEQAISETESMLKKDSLNPRLLYIKAYLYSENEDTARAIAAWEKVLEIDPKPENVMSLGSLYAMTKNPGALDMADALLMVTRQDLRVQAYFIKGLYYSSSREREKAIRFFDQCLEIDYQYLFAYREKAICYYDMAKYLEALKVLELSLAIKRTNEETYYWMGRCFEKLNQREQAIQNYELALQFDNNYIEAKDALGKLGVVK